MDGKNIIERWSHLENDQNIKADIIRLYDDLDEKWYLVYSDNSFSTIWPSQLIESIPMFVKRINRKSYIYFYRQYWMKIDNGHAWHIIEKSENGINDWMEVYRSFLEKVD